MALQFHVADGQVETVSDKHSMIRTRPICFASITFLATFIQDYKKINVNVNFCYTIHLTLTSEDFVIFLLINCYGYRTLNGS